MPRLVVTALLALLVLAAVGVAPALAQDQTHEGTVVSAADGKLVMTGADGKTEHTHMIGAEAKVTVDGKQAKLTDLKKGQKVKITAGKQGDKMVVSAVAATSSP